MIFRRSKRFSIRRQPLNERIFHVSDRAGIERFEPRPPPSAGSGQTGTMVWAVGERLLHNYLMPRDCPRVTFYTGPHTSAADAERWMGGTSARFVVAIETRWWPLLRESQLYLYELPATSFIPIDSGAGYYIAREAVEPLSRAVVEDLPGALLNRGIELRVMPDLWKLHDGIAASSMQFSIIRMRNAQPRSSLYDSPS